MKKLIFLASVSYLVIGMAHIVSGAVLESMLQHYGLAYQDGGQFIMNQFLGFLFGVLFSPWLSKKLGKKQTILISFAALTFAETAYSFLLPWGWMLTVAPVTGFGFGVTEAVIGAMVIDAIAEKKADAMSKIETFFGIGALVVPFIASWLIAIGYWQISFPVMAVMAGATTVSWLFFKQVPEEKNSSAADTKEAVRYPKQAWPLLMTGMLFFAGYVGLEMSLSNYLPSIMIGRIGMNEATAAMTISVFWGTMVIGRIYAGRIAEHVGYGRFLLVCVISGTILLALLNISESSAFSFLLIGLSGLVWAGTFAVALVLMNTRLPGFTERTTSLLIAAGGLGGALLPKATGVLMDTFSAGWAFLLLAAIAAMMLLLLVFLLSLGKSSQAALKT
ncbi:MFS transporter [Bacillaceae bacterium SIJ1]|uniref:MFS transporter n=1 Tax=Litoribacterium kuwaitense TaxID=1398745 RepID=UPI0013EADB5C|nr:MFS transporter [Litoribacterium kuwaitense]NGP44782.1 MFS transporter [Litoribacterium kuwaitense]